MKNHLEDTELWKAFKKGNKTAFSILYHKNVKVLLKYGQKITNDTQLIEDAIQDLFVDLWYTRENLTDPDSVKFYLISILRRKIIRTQILLNSNEELDDQNQQHQLKVESTEYEIVNREEKEIQLKNIHNALSNLPLRQQEVINLRYFYELSHLQISTIMGISVQSVHNVLHKATKSLEQLLENYWK